MYERAAASCLIPRNLVVEGIGAHVTHSIHRGMI